MRTTRFLRARPRRIAVLLAIVFGLYYVVTHDGMADDAPMGVQLEMIAARARSDPRVQFWLKRAKQMGGTGCVLRSKAKAPWHEYCDLARSETACTAASAAPYCVWVSDHKVAVAEIPADAMIAADLELAKGASAQGLDYDGKELTDANDGFVAAQAQPPADVQDASAVAAGAAATAKGAKVERVVCATSAGEMTIDVTRSWSPHGADRFLTMVNQGYFVDLAFYRAVKGFLVQFGLTDRLNPAQVGYTAIPDDPQASPPVEFEEGVLAFAGSGKNSRTTELFFSYGGEKSEQLGKNPWETPIGKLTAESLPILRKLYSGYGDMPPWGKGPDPSIYAKPGNGNSYLKAKFPKLSYFETCEVLSAADNAALANQARFFLRISSVNSSSNSLLLTRCAGQPGHGGGSDWRRDVARTTQVSLPIIPEVISAAHSLSYPYLDDAAGDEDDHGRCGAGLWRAGGRRAE